MRRVKITLVSPLIPYQYNFPLFSEIAGNAEKTKSYIMKGQIKKAARRYPEGIYGLSRAKTEQLPK